MQAEILTPAEGGIGIVLRNTGQTIARGDERRRSCTGRGHAREVSVDVVRLDVGIRKLRTPPRGEPIVDRELRALAAGAIAVLIGRAAADVGIDDDLIMSQCMENRGFGAEVVTDRNLAPSSVLVLRAGARPKFKPLLPSGL